MDDAETAGQPDPRSDRPGDSHASWRAHGYGDGDAAEWRRAAPDVDAAEAAAWRALGLGPEEAGWYAASTLPTIADDWLAAGLSGGAMYRAHRARLTLQRVRPWLDAGVDIETILEWAPFGFEPSDVEGWTRVGFRAAAAAAWRRAGHEPAAAAASQAAGKLPMPVDVREAIVLGRIPRPDDPPDGHDPPSHVRDRAAELAEMLPHVRPGYELPEEWRVLLDPPR